MNFSEMVFIKESQLTKIENLIVILLYELIPINILILKLNI